MTEAEYLRALDDIERKIAQAYLQQASSLTARASLADIIALINAGDMIKTAQYFEHATYGAMFEEIRAAFIAGGQSLQGELPRRLTSDFDVSRPQAASWLSENTRTTLTAIRVDQANAIQATVSAGGIEGRPPEAIARNILGMKRADEPGGVVGLGRQDAQWLQNAREQLLTGDKRYFDRKLRDKRLDGIAQRAIDAGKPVAQSDIDKITQKYAHNLLKMRAETVASIQSVSAYNAGRNAMYQQMVDDGINPALITKRWKTRADERVRVSHREMNGQLVPGGAPFVTPSGIRMMNPGDTSMGAGLDLTANCRCRAVYKVIGED